jgi:hypothetical protein
LGSSLDSHTRDGKFTNLKLQVPDSNDTRNRNRDLLLSSKTPFDHLSDLEVQPYSDDNSDKSWFFCVSYSISDAGSKKSENGA